MNPYLITCYQSPFPKKRIGKDYDGGYIIVNVPNIEYSILLGAGICDDISFEEDFVSMYPTIQCNVYDGTIHSLPPSTNNDHSIKDKITFVKKNIGPQNDETTTNLHDIINANDNIFLKMDIEGAEIPWISSLNNEQLNRFSQIVMEFHTPFSNTEIDVFNKINQNHYLVHFHANNCCGVRNHRGVNIPNVFECTYLHKKYFNNIVPPLNTDVIPSDLDMPNDIAKPDIPIDYPPFVYNAQ